VKAVVTEGGPLGVPMDHPRAVRASSHSRCEPRETEHTKQRIPNKLGLKPQGRSYTGLQRTCGGGGTLWESVLQLVDHTHLRACVAEGDGWKDCEMGVSTSSVRCRRRPSPWPSPWDSTAAGTFGLRMTITAPQRVAAGSLTAYCNTSNRAANVHRIAPQSRIKLDHSLG
jgi:hypothetical protein